MDCLGLLSPESAILSFLFFEPHRIRGTSTLKCVRCAKVISCSSPRFQRWSLLSQWSQQKDIYMIHVRIYHMLHITTIYIYTIYMDVSFL